MIYMILLQASQTNINDITFRTMDVVLIVGGVISVLTSFFVLRFQSQSNKEKIVLIFAEMDKLENKIDKAADAHGDFKKDIFAKMDAQNERIHELTLGISEFKNEILKEIKK